MPVQFIEKRKGSFVETVKEYSKTSFDLGLIVLCIHTDSDAATDQQVFQNKINPAFGAIEACPDSFCKNLVSIVPIQMIEAWMLADKDLLKYEIGTDKNDTELGINKRPESFSDPKSAIEAAIRIARQDLTKKRRTNLTIGELYQPIGQKIPIAKLQDLASYQKFSDAVRDAYRRLNYLS